jgi:hypothetical protein
MPYVFNPFTGNLDETGAGTRSSWQPPVANFAALPGIGNQDGDARVTLDTQDVYVYRMSDTTWVLDTGVTIGTFNTTSTPNGLDVSPDSALTLHAADGTNPGALTALAQNIGGNKTFLGDVSITGGSGFGGTWTNSRSFTNVSETSGSAISGDGSDGSVFTIKELGNYTIEYGDLSGSISFAIGIVLDVDSSQKTVNLSGLPIANRLGKVAGAAGNVIHVSMTKRLRPGQVIRFWKDASNGPDSTDVSNVWARITQVSK